MRRICTVALMTTLIMVATGHLMGADHPPVYTIPEESRFSHDFKIQAPLNVLDLNVIPGANVTSLTGKVDNGSSAGWTGNIPFTCSIPVDYSGVHVGKFSGTYTKQGHFGDGAGGVIPTWNGSAEADVIKIVTRTIKAAPDGTPPTRRTVGVCEVVELSTDPPLAVNWSASAALHDTPLVQNNSPTYLWTAMDTDGSAVITATAPNGWSSTVTIRAIPPNATFYDNQRGFAPALSQQANIRLLPLNVCFGNIWYREEPGPATTPTDDFTQIPAGLFLIPPPEGYSHNPGAFFKDVEDTNYVNVPDRMAGPNPAINNATGETPIYGGFQWVIPNSYSCKENGGHVYQYTTVTQEFSYTRPPPEPAGNGIIKKGNLPPFVVPSPAPQP